MLVDAPKTSGLSRCSGGATPSLLGNGLTASNVRLQGGRFGPVNPRLLSGSDRYSFIYSPPAFSPYGLGHFFGT